MKKCFTSVFVIFFVLFLSGCFIEKNSPFYDSQWIMHNMDENGIEYYHHLILQPEHKVTLRVSYFDSTNITVWEGTYKIDSKKITFNFKECNHYEDGKIVGQYQDTRIIKFYSGEFLYSIAEIGVPDKKYHLQLIRPKNQIYGEAKDIFNNHLEVFVKMENQEDTEE